MDKHDAIDALNELGLTSYEAEVFITLQQIGTGSASDVFEAADIPRSQVYGAAEKLEERGLLEVQRSNPIRYRPIPLDEARERLRSQYERREDRAFEYLERVRADRYEVDEQREDIWTLRGRASVNDRVTQMVTTAEEHVFYGGWPDTFDDSLVDELTEKASNGVGVTVVTTASEVFDQFEDEEDVKTCKFPPESVPEDRRTCRILLVDNETMLLSVLSSGGPSSKRAETAIWGEKTGFAEVIAELFSAWFEAHLEC